MKKSLQLKLTMFLLAGITATVGCTADGDALLEMTVTNLGTTGGIARSSDGFVSVEFSDGALAQDTDISVTVYRDHGRSGVITPVYEFGPDGLEFDAPVTLTIQVPGSEATVLELANLDGQDPEVLIDSAQTGNAVSGTLEHFSSYGVVLGTSPGVTTSTAGVTGGTTSVLLDLPALSAAGLDVSGFSDAAVVPGDLGPDSVAFPINPRSGTQSTTFVYDFTSFAPIAGTIEHVGLIYFDQQFASGNFSIGYDATRATGGNSGFFVASTTEGFLLIPGVFFDIEAPTFVDAQPNSLTIEANLRVAPELADFLTRPAFDGRRRGRRKNLGHRGTVIEGHGCGQNRESCLDAA